MGSIDVEALYPIIDQKKAARMVKEEYIALDVEVTELDLRMVALCMALTVKKEELIREEIYHLTARRKKNVRGRKPTVRSPKFSGPLKKKERREKTQVTDTEDEDRIRIGERLDMKIMDTEPDEN